MKIRRKLSERAQRAAGYQIPQTLSTELHLLAASQAYARLRQLRGKLKFNISLNDLKADR